MIFASTAMPNGTLRQCICGEDIAVGVPAAGNEYGVQCHAECAGLTPREAQARVRDTAPTTAARMPYTGPVATHAPDLGDLVADRMEALMGITRRVERQHTAERHVSQAIALRPAAGPRDLGDEVADRMEVAMFGSIRGAK